MYKKAYGFTVVELLIVVVVVGILAVVSIIAYGNIQHKATESLMSSELHQASKSLNTTVSVDGVLPSEAPDNLIQSTSKDATRVYAYHPDSEATTFCLEGYSTKHKTVQLFVIGNGSVQEGLCPQSTGPGGNDNIAATPDACFAFSSIGVISNYYNYENNVSTSPTCPREVVLAQGVTSIGNTAFAGKQLTSVRIPGTVTSIGSAAFRYNKFTSLNIPDGVATIGADAFMGNYTLASVEIPNSVTSIGGYAFYNNALTSVVLSTKMTRVADYVFRGNQLESVTIPNGITAIGIEAFANNKLTSVSIPDSVTRISQRAFMNNQITSISIPAAASVAADSFDSSVVVTRR